MPKVITIAQVSDAAKWEAAFRTHVELFRQYSVKNHVDFTTNGNEIIVCMEPEDLAYLNPQWLRRLRWTLWPRMA